MGAWTGLAGLNVGQLVGCSEHGNEMVACIKFEAFFD